jgi:predicted RNA-binding protein Jag
VNRLLSKSKSSQKSPKNFIQKVDRRLIHTTLNDIADVETKSEGEGLYKQVRVYYRGLR